ncbi:hypothetical protein ACF3NR_08020 [Vaginella massiliensis]|uniref:hypothetical protein n=1 Tax=Vaginella massiliensis TaxID=1816680 RepID=UPI003751F053
MMIVFDFVAYKVYKWVVKYKQYEGIEYLPTAGAMGFAIIPLIMLIVTKIEQYFSDKSIVSKIVDLGKIPAFIIITLPLMVLIYYYLRANLYKIEDKIAKNKILQILDRIPNFIVYYIFLMFNCALMIFVVKIIV